VKSKSEKARRKARQAKRAERSAQKAQSVQVPVNRNPEVLAMRMRGGEGFHSTKKGKRGYRRTSSNHPDSDDRGDFYTHPFR